MVGRVAREGGVPGGRCRGQEGVRGEPCRSLPAYSRSLLLVSSPEDSPPAEGGNPSVPSSNATSSVKPS